MMHKHQLLGIVAFLTLTMAANSTALGGAYQDAVISLAPDYYYQLNETDPSDGIVDTMGNVAPGILNGDYSGGGPEIGVPGPDFMLFDGAWTPDGWPEELVGIQVPLPGLGDGNTAHASNNAGHINLGDSDLFGSPTMTVAMFVKGGPAQGGDRLFTNNLADPSRSFQLVTGNDGLVISVDPSDECVDEATCKHRSIFLPEQATPLTNQGADRGMLNADNGWWHVIATTTGSTGQERAENIRVWLNGVERTADMAPGTTGWGRDTDTAKIGGRRSDPADSTTHSGAQDEVAIWLQREAFTEVEAQLLFDAAVSNVVVGPSCDFDSNGSCDLADMDNLLGAVGSSNSRFDLDNSGTVDSVDIASWLESAGNENQGRPFLAGDANLDGIVDATDLNNVGLNWQSNNVSSWADGDFNGDKTVDASDLNFIGVNWQQGAAAAPLSSQAVPEPSGIALVLGALLLTLGRARSACRTEV